MVISFEPVARLITNLECGAIGRIDGLSAEVCRKKVGNLSKNWFTWVRIPCTFFSTTILSKSPLLCSNNINMYTRRMFQEQSDFHNNRWIFYWKKYAYSYHQSIILHHFVLFTFSLTFLNRL